MPSREWRLSSRGRFLRKRRKLGKVRPLPFDVGEANCQGVTKSPAVVRHNIREAAKRADLIFFSEVANVRASLALGPGWDVHQGGDAEGESDKAGCAIAVRKTRGKLVALGLVFGCSAGLGIRDRWIPEATVVVDGREGRWRHAWSEKVCAYHAPPMRAWAKWAGYMARLARCRPGIAGGDGNKPARAVQAALRRRVRGYHVTGVAHRWWIPSTRVRTYDIGSDHPMTVTTLWP